MHVMIGEGILFFVIVQHDQAGCLVGHDNRHPDDRSAHRCAREGRPAKFFPKTFCVLIDHEGLLCFQHMRR